ncbi:hypothetical protein G5B30_06140 [Sphingobacterium sp. SGG-5]|uniref:hypothetical protein n=1 Tax=Sphingobacterium sp. SGG-5 TaxID=2710881 RepID=UPI0013EACD2A|nr:hypothetical protein [Sphingobacterium sp. SGG-5]NGM61498.1 hypothetical protein [Sphingobacterium sp. SGG-5]
MKSALTKLYVLIFLLALGACKKDEGELQLPNGFAVDVTQNVTIPYAVTSKDEIVFDLTISAKAEAQIQEAILRLDEVDLETASVTANEINLNYTYAVTAADVGRSLIFRLTIIDAEGTAVDKDFTIYVQSAPADVQVSIPAEAPNEVKDNEEVAFTVSVTSENEIRYIKTLLDQTELTDLTKETFDDPNADEYDFFYQPTVADADKTLSFTIEVMDVLGNIHRQPYSLFVERSVEADFVAYYDVHLGAQKSTGPGPFFNASTGEVYVTAGSAAKSADIDLATFFSGSTTAYNLTSPTFGNTINIIYTPAAIGEDAMENWSVRNQTLIKKITLTRGEFDMLASAAEIEALYTGSSVAESETSGGLANGHVIVFKTAAGKYGVLYVVDRSANANTGYLKVDVKMQK